MIAIFLSVALGPAVDRVKRLKLPRAASILARLPRHVPRDLPDRADRGAADRQRGRGVRRRRPELHRRHPLEQDAARVRRQVRHHQEARGAGEEPAEQARSGRRRAAGGDGRRLLDRDPARHGAHDHVLPAARRRPNSELHPRPGAPRRTRNACAQIAADIYSATGGYVAGALALATAAGISHLHRAQHPRRAVRRATRGADGVLRPDPARRLDDRRRARRRRHAVRRLPRRHDHLGHLRGRLPAGREQRLPAVRLPARGEPASAGGDHGDPDRLDACSGCSAPWWRSRSPRRSRSRSRTSGRTAASPVVGAAGEPIPARGDDEPPRKVELPPGAAADAKT